MEAAQPTQANYHGLLIELFCAAGRSCLHLRALYIATGFANAIER